MPDTEPRTPNTACPRGAPMIHRSFRLFCLLTVCAAGPLALASPGWCRQEGRQGARVYLNAQRIYSPGSDANFYFSFPVKEVRLTLLRAQMGELLQQLLNQNNQPVDISAAPEVRSWTETADAASPQNFNRSVTFKAPEAGVYVLEARWGSQ